MGTQPSPGLPGGARLGIDYGQSRIGIAKTDPARIMASALQTLRTDYDSADEIADIVAQYEISAVYVGLPVLLSGKPGKAAAWAEEFARELAQLIKPVPVCLIDERLTTATSKSKLAAAGVSSRDFRTVVDQQAAVEILEHALDSEAHQGRLAGRIVTKR